MREATPLRERRAKLPTRGRRREREGRGRGRQVQPGRKSPHLHFCSFKLFLNSPCVLRRASPSPSQQPCRHGPCTSSRCCCACRKTPLASSVNCNHQTSSTGTFCLACVSDNGLKDDFKKKISKVRERGDARWGVGIVSNQAANTV